MNPDTVWTFKFTHKNGGVRQGKVFLPAGVKPDGKIAAVYGDLFHPDHYGVWDQTI